MQTARIRAQNANILVITLNNYSQSIWCMALAICAPKQAQTIAQINCMQSETARALAQCMRRRTRAVLAAATQCKMIKLSGKQSREMGKHKVVVLPQW